MAIEGPVKELSLFELFQLISFAKKTGVLNIILNDGTEYKLFFKEGFLVYLDTGKKLIQELQRRGILNDVEEKNLEELIRDGKVNVKEVSAVLKSIVENEIFFLLKLKEGFFKFEEYFIEPLKELELNLRIENLIMEGARRIDEAERILSSLPPESTIFVISDEIAKKDYIKLTSEEWEILSLIDGKKSIKDIIRIKGNELKTLKALYGLYISGILKISVEEKMKGKVKDDEVKKIDSLWKEEKYDEGIDYIIGLIEKYGDEPTLFYNLGYFYIKKMEFKKGLETFERFLKLSKNKLATREIEEMISGIKNLVSEIMKLEGEVG
uniref:DUF4388 domain-containing protein n=1 Tax=candidate division WOR-3 bacterium TaxID=2052148 RepID=A0A7C4Y6F3_UNCW3